MKPELAALRAGLKDGDPLAALDENDFRLQREQAEAELSAAKMVVAQALGVQEIFLDSR